MLIIHQLTLGMLLFTTATSAAPSKAAVSKEQPTPQQAATFDPASKHALEDIQLIQPHIITIEHFEELLRRAGEIFRPAAFQMVKETATPTATPAAVAHQHPAVPYQQMQPPAPQPYNFYLPLFDYDDKVTKLDAQSHQLGNIKPPPAPSDQEGHAQTDYYAAKPKKLPKKFSAIAKQVNIKWLNALENGAFENNGSTDDNSDDLPSKAVYLVHDERNRINFDDSFFGVQMPEAPANNEAHQMQLAAATQMSGDYANVPQQQQDGFLNQGEQIGGEEEDEEDLLAASQVPQVNYVTVKAEVV